MQKSELVLEHLRDAIDCLLNCEETLRRVDKLDEIALNTMPHAEQSVNMLRGQLNAACAAYHRSVHANDTNVIDIAAHFNRQKPVIESLAHG